MYILSLSLGDDYTDSEGEVVGSDYYLSLARLSAPGISSHTPKILGSTEEILKIESFDGRKASFVSNTEVKSLSLNYKIGQRKVNLNCQILSLR